jgi:hypothetical protein
MTARFTVPCAVAGEFGYGRIVDVRHHRHADFVRDLERDVERHGARAARGASADADLDADDDVAIGVGDLHRIDRRHQPDLLALADHHPRREGVDAGEGDVEISEDAHRAALDHVLAEARKVAGPGAAGIDGGGHARPAAEIFRVDAERGPAPVDVGM